MSRYARCFESSPLTIQTQHGAGLRCPLLAITIRCVLDANVLKADVRISLEDKSLKWVLQLISADIGAHITTSGPRDQIRGSYVRSFIVH